MFTSFSRDIWSLQKHKIKKVRYTHMLIYRTVKCWPLFCKKTYLLTVVWWDASSLTADSAWTSLLLSWLLSLHRRTFQGGDGCDTCPNEAQIARYVPKSTVLPSHFFKRVAGLVMTKEPSFLFFWVPSRGRLQQESFYSYLISEFRLRTQRFIISYVCCLSIMRSVDN